LFDRHRRDPLSNPLSAGFDSLSRDLLAHALDTARGRAE
jgi:hypothetical protein